LFIYYKLQRESCSTDRKNSRLLILGKRAESWCKKENWGAWELLCQACGNDMHWDHRWEN